MASGKGAAMGAIGGATAGSVFGPWGTAIGAGVGGLAGLFAGPEDVEASQNKYIPNKESFYANEGAPPWAKSEAGWLRQYESDPRYQKNARSQQGQMRDQYVSALDMMAARARGENSIAEMASQRQREKNIQDIQSQLASARGGYNPANFRSAQYLSSAQQQNLAGATAVAAAQERQAAEEAYLKAIATGRQQDLSLFGLETGARGQSAQEWALKNQLAAEYTRMGLGEKEAQRNAMIAYEQLMAGRGESQANRDYGYQQQKNTQDWNTMLGIMNAGSGFATAYAKGRGGNGGGNSGGGGTVNQWGLMNPWD